MMLLIVMRVYISFILFYILSTTSVLIGANLLHDWELARRAGFALSVGGGLMLVVAGLIMIGVR